MLRDWFCQFWKVGGLKLPIMQTLFVFHLFSNILHLGHIKHTFGIFSLFWCIIWCFWMFLAVQVIEKWWVFTHSSIPHTKLLLVPSNLLWKINGFHLFTKSHYLWSSQCFSMWYFGTMITKWFSANHQLSTDLICLYQKPFASGLANSWWNSQHLGELITNYGFSTAFTTSHNLSG